VKRYPAEPLLWTSKGNLPIASLQHRPHWEDSADATVLVDEYFLGEESVHRSVHVLSKRGVTGEAIAAQLPGA